MMNVCVALLVAAAVVADVPSSTPVANAAPTPAIAAVSAVPSPARQWESWSLGLLSGGAVVAAASTTTLTLVQALLAVDDGSDEAPSAQEAFVQSAGFAAAALTSVSAVMMVAGASLLLSDVLQQPAPIASGER